MICLQTRWFGSTAEQTTRRVMNPEGFPITLLAYSKFAPSISGDRSALAVRVLNAFLPERAIRCG